MPRKNAPKPSKRAKLSGIGRFFKDLQQVVQTSALVNRASSDSGNDLISTPSTSTVNQQQSSVIHVDNPPTSLAEFTENDEAESQGISCAAIAPLSLANEQRPPSVASDSSDFFTSNRCSTATVSASSSFTAKSSSILNLDKPNHPKLSVIPAQRLATRTLYFQSKWYEDYEWIHYDPDLKKILCFHCSKASAMGIIDLAHNKDPAFISEGFNNWKKAIEKFKLHQTSHTHVLSVNQIAAVKRPSVIAQIQTQKQKEQAIARNSLLKLFTSVRYLLRQGSGFRGHDESDGSYPQLLKLRTEDVPDLQMYLKNTTNFTSPCAQNEMIEMFSHHILRKIVSDIQLNEFYAVTVDGTKDISGKEQESFCLRHVDSDLYVHEDFIGLYEVPSTTGDVLARTLFDVLARCGLSISNMRGQTYDGASNMSGCYSGCKARVQERQPLALFFHCGSHASNLVMQHAVTSCQLIRDSLQWLNELGVLMKRSGKYKAIFLAICESTEDDNLHPTAIKPLCATRWLCRLAAIQSALDQYPAILQSLEEMARDETDTATKANGLFDRFQKGKVFLGLKMAAKPVAILEQLNSALQSKSANMSGMVEAVKTSSTHISAQRTDEVFHELFSAAEEKCEEYQLDPLEVPRARVPPRRYTGEAAEYRPNSSEEYYRKQYFEFIDSIVTGLSARYDPDKSGLAQYLKLETMLTSGKVDEEVVSKYPELDGLTLPIQLEMFKQTFKAESLHEAKVIYRSMEHAVHLLFPQVLVLLKLLLVCPVSSCECERSFSALRRLKTWLRTTMTQRRLNHISICHVHQEQLDNVNVHELAKLFVEKSEIRRNLFGTFK